PQGHVLPQDPQFQGSLSVSVQSPLQGVSGASQDSVDETQLCALHICPPAHCTPQPPQLALEFKFASHPVISNPSQSTIGAMQLKTRCGVSSFGSRSRMKRHRRRLPLNSLNSL